MTAVIAARVLVLDEHKASIYLQLAVDMLKFVTQTLYSILSVHSLQCLFVRLP